LAAVRIAAIRLIIGYQIRWNCLL